MWNVIRNDEIKHFGLLGMKWGVRRFQNPDRTWTEEGKIRYGRKANEDGEEKRRFGIFKRRQKKSKEEIAAERSTRRVKKASKKQINPSSMSNEELMAAIDRLSMEKRYKDLVDSVHPKSHVVMDIAKNLATDAITTYGHKKIGSIMNEHFLTDYERMQRDISIQRARYDLKEAKQRLKDYDETRDLQRRYQSIALDNAYRQAELDRRTYEYRTQNYDAQEEANAQRGKKKKGNNQQSNP